MIAVGIVYGREFESLADPQDSQMEKKRATVGTHLYIGIWQ